MKIQWTGSFSQTLNVPIYSRRSKNHLKYVQMEIIANLSSEAKYVSGGSKGGGGEYIQVIIMAILREP